MDDRFYVQHLAERIFLVRERMFPDVGPGPDDRIVRSFDVRLDAYMFADSMNQKQRASDEMNNEQNTMIEEGGSSHRNEH